VRSKARPGLCHHAAEARREGPAKGLGTLFLALALCLLVLVLPKSSQAATCSVADMASLQLCVRSAAPQGRIVFTADVVCTTAQECCPGGAAPLRLSGIAGLVIDGQGRTLRRRAGQKACQALVVRNAPNLTIANLTFDEDEAAPPCELAEKPCPPTLDIGSTTGVLLDGVRVLWGKGYVVKLWTVADFTMQRSEVADAGIIGFYAGHFRYGASRNITIEGSRFLRSRTNGVAIQGADDVVLRDNVFAGNHWHGLWPVANVAGGITSGGQLLLAQGARMVVAGNRFTGGGCGNCVPAGQIVTAIEVGEGPNSPGVHGLAINGNRICRSGPGMAIYNNPGAATSAVTITGNRFGGYTGMDNVRGNVVRAANAITPGETCL
jgi:hypothetical protein